MKAKLIKFYEYLTTMAHGAYVRLSIEGFEIDAYLSADTGLFCPFADDPKEKLPEGMILELTASIQDNSDRYIFERNASEKEGIRQAEPEYIGGGKIEKIFVGKISKIIHDEEIEITSDKIIASYPCQNRQGLKIGELVKVVGDLIFYPKRTPSSDEEKEKQ